MTNHEYINWLQDKGFNEEQLGLLITERRNYLLQKEEEYFDEDVYERDMWYMMNRSGLFERDKNNKTEIYDWTPSETRTYITEL